MCLALTVYFEARSEPVAGQLAVAQVVTNRVKDERFANNVCEVVYQGGETLHRCHFSWYCDGKSDQPFDAAAWDRAKLVASAALAGSGHAELKGVTHYHATYVDPYWTDSMILVATFDTHNFYRDLL